MKRITITSVDEIIDALQSGKILYDSFGGRYWMYKGIILSSDAEDDGAVVRINSHIDTNREYVYYG